MKRTSGARRTEHSTAKEGKQIEDVLNTKNLGAAHTDSQAEQECGETRAKNEADQAEKCPTKTIEEDQPEQSPPKTRG